MPLYSRSKRSLYRYQKSRAKWASQIKVFNNQIVTSSPYEIVLCANSTEAATPTPTVIKTANFKVSIDAYVNYAATTQANIIANAYIIFIPQGMAVNASLPLNHPEYIMAAKTVGSSLQSGAILSLDTLNMSSRLKRNLNSGDKISLIITLNSTTTPSNCTMSGMVRFWTKAN